MFVGGERVGLCRPTQASDRVGSCFGRQEKRCSSSESRKQDEMRRGARKNFQWFGRGDLPESCSRKERAANQDTGLLAPCPDIVQSLCANQS